MGTSSMGRSACAHGGIYSVNHRQVKVDCSSSVNPLGTPARAIKAIVKGARTLSSRYPDPDCVELRKNLGDYLGVEPEWIVVGNGAVEIIYWFAHAFAGKQAVVHAPTFCEYELASERAGASVKFVGMRNFRPDADSIISAAAGADAIFLCNPNNPTGLLASREMQRVVENADKKTLILLDECFIELAGERAESLIDRTQEFENLVVLRSMTKSFALAGLRLGYAVCNPHVLERLKRQRVPWNVNGLAQAAGVAALADRGYLKRAREMISRERKFLREKIAKMSAFIPLGSDTNFFMVNLQQKDSTRFRNDLLKKTGVLVRDCSTFTGMDSHHVRIAVKNRRENLLLLKALEGL